ncbi:MAG: pilus assembly FimT family protein, partial [Chroococcidiopsis sp.]
IVVIIVGVLAAIAGPSWVAFVQQQKLSKAADKVYCWEVIGAQSVAKKDKLTKSPPTTIQDIDPTVTVTYPTTMIQFDYRGAVKNEDVIPYRTHLRSIQEGNRI